MAERVPVHLRYLSTQSVEEFYECVVKNNGVPVPHYATEVWIDPAHAALPDSTLSPEGKLAAYEGVGLQSVGHHDLETYSTWSARRHWNQPRQDGRDSSSGSAIENTSNTTQEEASAQDNASTWWKQDRQYTGRKSNVTGAVDVEVGMLADQIARVNVGIVAAQVTPSGQWIKQLLTPHLYQSLPTLWVTC